MRHRHALLLYRSFLTSSESLWPPVHLALRVPPASLCHNLDLILINQEVLHKVPTHNTQQTANNEHNTNLTTP